jgi:hypothetical protein
MGMYQPRDLPLYAISLFFRGGAARFVVMCERAAQIFVNLWCGWQWYHYTGIADY